LACLLVSPLLLLGAFSHPQKTLKHTHTPLHTQTNQPKHAGGELIVGPGLKEAYETGNGSFTLNATMSIEGGGNGSGNGGAARAAKGRRGRGRGGAAAVAGEDEDAVGGGGDGRQLIVVTEMPYQTNKVRVWGRSGEGGGAYNCVVLAPRPFASLPQTHTTTPKNQSPTKTKTNNKQKRPSWPRASPSWSRLKWSTAWPTSGTRATGRVMRWF
jgi:hypothetical protein